MHSYVTYVFVCVILCSFVTRGDTELLVNVQNQGGDVVQERLSANVTENTVNLEFQRPDGTLVTMLIDFNNDVEILRALVLGEEERGQSQYQVMCFVSHHRRGDFIPADAMARLRQKNPGAVRAPDDDLGRDEHPMDRLLDVTRAASTISRHVASTCTEALAATYTRRDDLIAWAQRPGASESTLLHQRIHYPLIHRQQHVETWYQFRLHASAGLNYASAGIRAVYVTAEAHALSNPILKIQRLLPLTAVASAHVVDATCSATTCDKNNCVFGMNDNNGEEINAVFV